jgi:hypothetical protein
MLRYFRVTALFLLVACSESEPGDRGSNGGGGGADTGGRGGAANGGTAGNGTGGNATGGSATGGSAGNTGGKATGGNETGGSAGEGGMSGSSTGGMGGSSTPPAGCAFSEPTGDVFYVATDGSDDGDGSDAEPWATITHAIENVPDGSTVLVRPGDYEGRVELDGVFAEGIVVRSEEPYQARLRNTGAVVTSYYGEGITLEGFDIAHSGPGGALVIQIQNLRDDGGVTRDIVIRNNVLHDSYDNDILKINNGAAFITVERNVFYNQTGSDEHIDINSVTDVVVQDNVFFNDFEGSGRTNGNDTSSYVVIKDSNADDDQNLGSDRITVRRNVFFNWQGNTGANFVLIGEDGTANFEAMNVLVENNLMLGNSENELRAAFGVKGSQDITFRNNTISGDLPSLAFAFRLNVEGDNQPSENVVLANNVWSDPTGSMEDFSDTPAGETASFTLSNNAYWNDGAALPEDAAELVNPSDDSSAVTSDPELGDPSTVALPRWDPDTGRFGDGSSSTCEVFERLVEDYARPSASSSLIDAADASLSAEDDILGRARSGSPDIGAFEAE